MHAPAHIAAAPANGAVGAGDAPMTYAAAEASPGALGPGLKLYWVFPNMVLAVSPGFVAVVLLQASGVEKALARCFLLTSAPEAQAAAPARQRHRDRA